MKESAGKSKSGQITTPEVVEERGILHYPGDLILKNTTKTMTFYESVCLG